MSFMNYANRGDTGFTYQVPFLLYASIKGARHDAQYSIQFAVKCTLASPINTTVKNT